MKNLDFLIIGAQKSATTSLHAYLAGHPDIAMPASKEAPFFDRDNTGPQAWERFTEEHFAGRTEQLWGKASPQYMAHPDAPRRIYRAMPSVRLIAILRDPVERAWSHYRMCLRRETEQRSFDEAISTCLDRINIRQARDLPPPRHEKGFEPEGDFYLSWGEYGRILGEYRRYFPRSQILVLTTSELASDPALVMDRILKFLGLPLGYRPDNLGKVVHRGASAPLVTQAWKERIRSIPLLSHIWRCTPESRRASVRFWVEQLNLRRAGDEVMKLSEINRARLERHFSLDVMRLQRDFGLLLPWRWDYLSHEAANCESEAVANRESAQVYDLDVKLSNAAN
jgi:hypothetical protein